MNGKSLMRVFSCGLYIAVIISLLFTSSTPILRVQAQDEPIVPWIRVHPVWDSVDAWQWPLDATLHLTIDDPATEDSPDLEMDKPGDDDELGSVWFEFAGKYDLKTGDVVTVTDGTTTQSLTVSILEITSVDAEENTISGIVETEREVRFPLPDGELFVTAEKDGKFQANLNEFGFDLNPGMMLIAEVYHEGGLTSYEWAVPDFGDRFVRDLSSRWTWLNENPERWSLTEQPGFLRIYTSPYPTGDENLLVRGVAEPDFAIETHLLFEPNTNFQFAGLVIYQDDANFLQFGRAFCDIEGPCVGNGIYFDYVVDDSIGLGPNFATPVSTPNEAYLRLEKRGEMVRALFSFEGITWFEIGTHWISPDFVVNAVGLTSSQDTSDPYEPVPADFDYFELTMGHGFLPEGFHDGDQGDVPSWACSANGWAVDPDDRDFDINVEINVDGEKIEEFLPADQYRPDLEENGGCVGGSCGFFTNLWDRISSYETHQVTAYAQDIETGEWVQLSASPKELTCRTYDIYTYDPLTGETVQITNISDMDEYNPHFSPNGKQVVHHTVMQDGSYALYLTDLVTGVSTPLPGGDSGGFASFSPNGRWISFSQGDSLWLYASAGGSDPLKIREDADMPAWAPNGKRLVYRQPSDGSLHTIAVDRGKGGVTELGIVGDNPEWSPDGNWIVFNFEGDIWKLPVSMFGVPLGEAIQLTRSILDESHPSWSPDGQTIVFHAGMTPAYDLWSVPAAGGEPTWLTGTPEWGDYDPGYLKNSGLVGYAGVSPNNQAPRTWVATYTYDLPDEYWAEGSHRYQFALNGALDGDAREFQVSRNVPRFDGTALLRPYSNWVRVGEGCDRVDQLNPNQPTQFNVGWTFDGTFAEAQSFFDTAISEVTWDDMGQPELMQGQPFYPMPTLDWWGYVCGFTAGPPKMDLRVNYGHDWVESFYEAGHEVIVTVVRGAEEFTQTVFTEPKDWWGGETGFQTVAEDWSPTVPDLQPGDWIIAEVDNGVTARVQLGTITGSVDVLSDSISGTIDASWLSDPVQVECLDWGSGNDPPFENKDGGMIPANGVDGYSCSWEGEWDVQPWQDIGVGYFTTEGHWVANAFRADEPPSGLSGGTSGNLTSQLSTGLMVNGWKGHTFSKV